MGLIGSCTNSSYEDLSRAASVAKQANDKNIKFLLTLLNVELMSSSWILQAGKYTIGRLSTHQIILDDVTVSRNHASIEINNEEVPILDGSARLFIEKLIFILFIYSSKIS